jgi:hypothetical protein
MQLTHRYELIKLDARGVLAMLYGHRLRLTKL